MVIKTMGVIPEQKKLPIWAGVCIICDVCGCDFELEAQDKVQVSSARTPGAGHTISICCPTCGKLQQRILR